MAAALPVRRCCCCKPGVDDFRRVQENLIGHLVVQKLKLSPTLFIATLESELEVISVCNLSGEVIKETLGTAKRTPFPLACEFPQPA
jgi:hypothetical protein